MMKPKVFRIISWGGIGDAILTTPSFRALKERYPPCKIIVYCVSKNHREGFKNNPYIDRVKLAKFYSDPIQYIKNFLKRGRFYWTDYGNYNPSFHDYGKAMYDVADMLYMRLQDKRLQIFLSEDEAARARAFISDYPNAVALHASPE